VTSNPAAVVRVERDGGVATVTLDRPDALNAITRDMLLQLGAALDELAADESVQVVVLTGEGRAFSAGVDLKALGDRNLTDGAVGDHLDVPGRAVITALTTMPKVVIAKVNGFCFTGALELALACDLIVVADEAKLGDTHAKFGLRPSWGMSQRLIPYTAATFTGAQAAEWGIAAQAVPPAELDETVRALADTIRSHSAGALAAYKDLYREALDGGLADGLAYEEATRYPIEDTEKRVAGFR
jgi:enoyl-CoA hydratase